MRSRNMQKLTDQLKAKYPGIVVYGIGDAAHKGSASGHNEDDTPGSRPEDQDSDNIPEHRAIDPMIGRTFTTNEAWKLVNAMVTLPENRRRLLYVIFMRYIWRRNGGWVRENYTGSNPHTDHPHLSGEADDDNNTADWTLEVPAPQAIQRRGIDMFLIHKRSAGVTFALVGETTFREWAPGDTIDTPTGPISGQALANAFAESLGDSREQSELEYEAIKATVTGE